VDADCTQVLAIYFSRRSGALLFTAGRTIAVPVTEARDGRRDAKMGKVVDYLEFAAKAIGPQDLEPDSLNDGRSIG